MLQKQVHRLYLNSHP